MKVFYHRAHKEHGVFSFIFSVGSARPGVAGRAGVVSVVKFLEAHVMIYFSGRLRSQR